MVLQIERPNGILSLAAREPENRTRYTLQFHTSGQTLKVCLDPELLRQCLEVPGVTARLEA